jgi:hypothetical protein
MLNPVKAAKEAAQAAHVRLFNNPYDLEAMKELDAALKEWEEAFKPAQLDEITLSAARVVDRVKKCYMQGHSLDRHKDGIITDLSKLFNTLVSTLDTFGFTTGETLQENVEKLAARHPGGFSTENDINRKEGFN